MSSSISDRVLAHAPSRVALIDGARQLTYGELAARVRRIAGGLAVRGVRKGDRVVVLVPISIDLYVTLLAIATLGAVAVFVEPAAGMREMARAIRTTRPVAFVGIPRAHLLRALVRVPLAFTPRQLDALTGELPAVTIAADDPALLTFSSGSTGTPKAAVRSHAFLAAQHASVSRFLDARPDDVHLSAFAIVLLSTLVDGGTAVIGRTQEPDARAIARHGVTLVSGSPAFLAPIAHALAGVRRVVSGGAPVPVELAEQIPQLRVVYGSTECEPIASIDAADVCETAARTRAGAGLCVGTPDAHLRVKLLAPTSAPILIGPAGLPEVSRGEVGEVVVAGPHVNQRYYRNPAAERAHKIHDVDGTIWHRTGDTAYRDERGRLWLVGRVADVVRRGDAAYHPAAVEAAARALPWVSRAALIESRGAVLVVQGKGSRAELTAHLAAHGVVIDRIAFARRLPVDPRHHAKLDLVEIRKQYA